MYNNYDYNNYDYRSDFNNAINSIIKVPSVVTIIILRLANDKHVSLMYIAMR